jgi:hypothetical protein
MELEGYGTFFSTLPGGPPPESRLPILYKCLLLCDSEGPRGLRLGRSEIGDDVAICEVDSEAVSDFCQVGRPWICRPRLGQRLDHVVSYGATGDLR